MQKLIKTLKQVLKKVPGLKALRRMYKKFYYSWFMFIIRKPQILYAIHKLKKSPAEHFTGNPDSNVIVSLTSYPARINHIWVTVESLFQQRHQPNKIVLVLSKDEFPSQALPDNVCLLIEKGLEVLWVEGNIRSYKKLIPVVEHYPQATIITVDDDIYYQKDFVEKLVSASIKSPSSIIGNRGRLIKKHTTYEPYLSWPLIKKQTTGNRVLLTGMGGILYPPNTLNNTQLLDINLAMSLCPNADDFWFWAVSITSKAPIICTGEVTFLELDVEVSTESLASLNLLEGKNDKQFQALLTHFNLQP